MKRTICGMLLCVFLLLPALYAGGETLTFRAGREEISADSETEYLNIELTKDLSDWNGFLDFLARFPRLKKVDMYGVPRMYTKKVKEIHERFPEIDFGMTMLFGDARKCLHSVRTDATAFSTLHGFDPAWHSCSEMSVLKYCKNLYALDIGHNSFDDLSFLYEMPQLRVLIAAAGNAVDITPIGSLKHLEYLEIFVNNIRDISCLQDMPYLLDLNVEGNLIEDITPVKKLKSLKRLWIFQYTRAKKSPVDEATMAELQAALPGCHIDGHSTSTDGGWRKDKNGVLHPHYEIIRRMFRSGVYEPFADSPSENIPEGFAPAPAE